MVSESEVMDGDLEYYVRTSSIAVPHSFDTNDSSEAVILPFKENSFELCSSVFDGEPLNSDIHGLKVN